MKDFFLASQIEEMDTNQLVRILEELLKRDREAFELLKEIVEDHS